MATAASPVTHTPRYRGWRLTRAGLFFLFLCAFVLVATVNSGVNVLYFALGMMLATLLVSLVLCAWSLRGIEITRDVGDHVIAGETADVAYTLRNTRRFLPAMAVMLREVHPDLAQMPTGFFLHLPARGPASRLATGLVARRRGIFKLKTIELSTAFPLGLFNGTRRVALPQEIIVYPRIGMLNRRLALEYREAVESGAMTSNRRGGADEFYGVREYRAGDNLRAIHWRSSARQGRFMIREMAANAPPQLIVLLNLRTLDASENPGERAERAIELAASLVCYGFYENFAVGLAIAGLSEDEAAPAPRVGRDARAVMLRRLAQLDPGAIDPRRGIHLPNRVAGRAQWVIVTLRHDDPVRDLSPPGQGAQVGPPGVGATTQRTILPLDAPDAGSWIRFLTHDETKRLLRERETT